MILLAAFDHANLKIKWLQIYETKYLISLEFLPCFTIKSADEVFTKFDTNDFNYVVKNNPVIKIYCTSYENQQRLQNVIEIITLFGSFASPSFFRKTINFA